MNKSEIELENVTKIMDEMPAGERALCVRMIASLMASIGNPIDGRVFMIAVAYTNCQVAVHNIKMGLVNQDGSEPAKFMQGDGKAFGGLKAEVLAVDECTKDNVVELNARREGNKHNKEAVAPCNNLNDIDAGATPSSCGVGRIGEGLPLPAPTWATHILQDGGFNWHYVCEKQFEGFTSWVTLDVDKGESNSYTSHTMIPGSLTKI